MRGRTLVPVLAALLALSPTLAAGKVVLRERAPVADVKTEPAQPPLPVPATPAEAQEMLRKVLPAPEVSRRLEAQFDRLADDRFDEREAAQAGLTGEREGLFLLLWMRAESDDPEVVRRVETLAKATGHNRRVEQLHAALKLMSDTPADGSTALMLDLISRLPDGDGLRFATVDHLTALTRKRGRPEAALTAWLDAKEADRRVVAAQVLGDALTQLPKELLARADDPDPQVRFLVRMAALKHGDRAMLPKLIDLLLDGNPRQIDMVEPLLFQLDPQAKIEPVGKPTPETRKAAFDGWSAWYKANADKIVWARLDEWGQFRGITLVAVLDGADQKEQKIIARDSRGKVMWQFGDLNQPIDVQALPNGRVLVAEWSGRRVAERDTAGKIVWEIGNVGDSVLGARRLSNGNTLVATRSQVFEYSPAKEIVRTLVNGATGSVSAVTLSNNGTIVFAVGNQVWLFRPGEKEPRKVTVAGENFDWGGAELLPNGEIRIACYTRSKILTVDGRTGKVLKDWKVNFSPTRTQTLPNGHVLCSGGDAHAYVELDATGRELSRTETNGRVFGVTRY